MSNEVKNNLESIFQSFQEMIKVETVVGEALHIGDAGGGGGAKLEPTAILVIKGERVEMFSIKQDGYHASGFEKLLTMAPEIIEKMKKDKYIYIKDDEETDMETPNKNEEAH